MRRYITADEAIKLLPEGDTIHTFVNMPMGLIGADWDRQEVIEKLRGSDKIEITGEQARSLGHGLAAYNESIKYQSDILFIETDEEKLNEFDEPHEEEQKDN